MKKISAALCGLMLIFVFFAGCRNGSSASKKHYTQRYRMSVPESWNPVTQKQDYLPFYGMLGIGLYDFAFNEAGNGSVLVPEMAQDFPEDVSSEYAGNPKFNIPEGGKGYAWRIRLNPQAKWQDGTPIDADTYEYSLRQYLSPQLKSPWAASWCEGKLSLANAGAYMRSGDWYQQILDEEDFEHAGNMPLYFSLTEELDALGNTMENVADWEEFYDDEGNCLYDELKELCGEKEYAPVTGRVREILQAIAYNLGYEEENSYCMLCFTYSENDVVPWESVGFEKNDSLTITYILSEPKSAEYVEYFLSSPYLLVKPDLFEASKHVRKGSSICRTDSSYATSVETSSSYGPYKLVSYSARLGATLERNSEWYGWTDGKHAGQYETTDIYMGHDYGHYSTLNLFRNGKVDALSITGDEYEEFAEEPGLLGRQDGSVRFLIVNSSQQALKKQNRAGINHSILSYAEFRKALSLCINREKLAASIYSGSDAANALISDFYSTGKMTGERYRNLPLAKEAATEGFDLKKAAECFEKAYNLAFAAGDILETDIVEINYLTRTESDEAREFIQFMQDSVNEGAKGTPLENRISIVAKTSSSMSEDIKLGKFDLAGRRCYSADSSGKMLGTLIKDYEICGFNPGEDVLAVNLGRGEETKTYLQWYEEMLSLDDSFEPGSEYHAILAALEKSLLEGGKFIPLCYGKRFTLYSSRIIPGSRTYIDENIAYGRLRYMKYSLDDYRWMRQMKSE